MRLFFSFRLARKPGGAFRSGDLPWCRRHRAFANARHDQGAAAWRAASARAFWFFRAVGKSGMGRI